jgi:two-component system sensor histidine kinase YesM
VNKLSIKIKNGKLKFISKKLSSINTGIILGINILLPLVTYVLILAVIKYQIHRGFIRNMTQAYEDRIHLLGLAFDILILVLIDVYYIFLPILRIENITKQYSDLAKMELKYDKYSTKSSMEKILTEMLKMEKELKKQQDMAETRRQKTELYALRTQINPHFLYNTLDSIRGLSLIHDAWDIAAMTEALSKLFRNMINKEGEFSPLREEVTNISNYMLIQEFRFNNRFDYECDIEEVLLDNYLVPNLIVQPIVENAIMHGLEKKVGRGKVVVSAYTTEKRLVIEVKDNGVGSASDKLQDINKKLRAHDVAENAIVKTSKGIGLFNINERIKLMYGDVYGIFISSTPNINTTVELVLPLVNIE